MGIDRQNPPESPLYQRGTSLDAPLLERGAGRILGHGVAGWSGKPGPHPERGFTLLELIAVLGLMALILALVLPGLRQSYGRERDRANLRRLVVALRAARSEAATNRQRVRVFLDLQNRPIPPGRVPGAGPAHRDEAD